VAGVKLNISFFAKSLIAYIFRHYHYYSFMSTFHTGRHEHDTFSQYSYSTITAIFTAVIGMEI